MAGEPMVPIRQPKFRLIHDTQPEDDLQADVADALRKLLLPPAQFSSFPAGHVKLTAAQAARLTRIGMARGWPDLLVIHRLVYGIELKGPDGRLSKTRLVRTRRGSLRQLDGQEDVFPRLEAAGMAIAICRSVTEVLTALAGFGVPLRRWS
jgi:hypothetical protein